MKPEPINAIDMLIADHELVKSLFAKFAALGDRSIVTKKKIADQICHELSVHMQVEEALFYPTVRPAIKDDDLVEEAEVEHASAKELIAKILAMDPGDTLYDATVTVLSEQIDHHVGEEEGEMFPKVRKSKVDLTALGQQMQALKEQSDSTVS